MPLSYVSTDDIATTVLQCGQGTTIAKSDISHAYRQIPVHPQDHLLLGKGRRLVDGTLHLGSAWVRPLSFPRQFQTPSNGYIVWAAGVSHIFHYIDDSVIVSPPAHCEGGLRTFLRTCERKSGSRSGTPHDRRAVHVHHGIGNRVRHPGHVFPRTNCNGSATY